MAVIEKLKLTGWYLYTKLIVTTTHHWQDGHYNFICDTVWINNLTNCLYGAPSIRELCDNWYCLMDGSACWFCWPSWFPCRPPRRYLHTICISLSTALLTWLCNTIPAGSPLQSNRKYWIELINWDCLPPPGKIGGSNQSLHPVKAVSQAALNCSNTKKKDV